MFGIDEHYKWRVGVDLVNIYRQNRDSDLQCDGVQAVRSKWQVVLLWLEWSGWTVRWEAEPDERRTIVCAGGGIGGTEKHAAVEQ